MLATRMVVTLLVLWFTAWTVLGSRRRAVLRPLGDTLQSVHHATHEDWAEEVLERTENVGVERQREEADDDEKDDDGKMDELWREVN